MQIGCIIETIGGYCPLVEGDVNLCDECGSIWLKAEHKEKPKLSDAERVILENIPKDYKWIVRDKNNGLKIFILKPEKECVTWIGKNNKFHFMDLYNHLFQFIKWEDTNPYNIEELLEGE